METMEQLLEYLETAPNDPIKALGNMVTLSEWKQRAFTRVQRAKQNLEPAPEPTATVSQSSRVSTNGDTTPSEPTFPL